MEAQIQLILAAVLVMFAIALFFVNLTINRLGSKINPYYEFTKFLPGSGRWSVVFYIILLAGLILLIILGSRFEFAPSPA